MDGKIYYMGARQGRKQETNAVASKVAHTDKPGSWKVEARRLRVQRQLQLRSKFKAFWGIRRQCFKPNKNPNNRATEPHLQGTIIFRGNVAEPVGPSREFGQHIQGSGGWCLAHSPITLLVCQEPLVCLIMALEYNHGVAIWMCHR